MMEPALPAFEPARPGTSSRPTRTSSSAARVKFAFGTENVQAVWFLESDMIWGDAAGGTPVTVGASTYTGGAQRNSGGALGADRIQIETKNLYLWFKVPDTSVGVTVGLQNQSDDYAGLIYGGADMAGVFVTGKYEPVTYKLGFAKLYENLTQKSDDMTLYVASAKFTPMKDVKLGLNFYYLQDDTGKNAGTTPTVLPLAILAGDEFSAKVYMPGIDVAFKLGPATLSGFAQYQTGTVESKSCRRPRYRHQRLPRRSARRHEPRPRQVLHRGALHERRRRCGQRLRGAHHAGHPGGVPRRELLLQPHEHGNPAVEPRHHQRVPVPHRLLRR